VRNNLCRTFPPDVNFLKIEGMELSKEATALGFPIEHRHKLSCLRQELIGEILLNLRFWEFSYRDMICINFDKIQSPESTGFSYAKN
jgi:hypothetical protein